MFLFFFLGIPVAFAILSASLTYFMLDSVFIPVDVALQRLITSAESFPLMAVPFFVTMGTVMNYAGITDRLLTLVNMFCGHWRGGLAQVNVLLSTFLGGISGSANADAAMQSKVLVPEMVKRGMSVEFSAAITATSAVIAPIIPPGIGLILYAFLADASVAKMFMGGYVPGLLMCAALMIAVKIIATRRNYSPTTDRRPPFATIIRQFLISSWALFLPFGIILGLRIGMFTPTEAGAMSVVYSFLIGMFVYRELKPGHIPAILLESVLGTAGVMLIICSASVLGYYMSWERIPQTISAFLATFTNNPWVFLGVVNVFLLIMGMFVEGTAVLIILTPLLIPTVNALGINPIHFGLVMVMNLTMGGVTPPFGTLIFVCCSILKISPSKLVREAVPFLTALLIVLGLVTYFPRLVLFLPELLLGA